MESDLGVGSTFSVLLPLAKNGHEDRGELDHEASAPIECWNIIGLVSAILVVGGIFLSLAETFPSLATPTQIPPTLELNFPTITPSLPRAQSETPTATPTATQTAGLASSASPSPTICAPPPAGWIRITLTASDTVYSIAQRYRTTTAILGAANCLSTLGCRWLPCLYLPFPQPSQ